MANPIKMRQHANGVYNDGVQLMSSSDMDYAAQLVLSEFSGSTNEVGDIFLGGTGTNIGEFQDQKADEAVGGHSSPEIISSNTVFNQNTGSVSESLTIPLTSNGSTFSPSTDSDINGGIVNHMLGRLALANSTFAERGTYYLSSSTPSISGSWVSKGNFTDEVTNDNADDGYDVTFNLWRKTSDTLSASTVRPMKLTGASSIHEMTDTEIKSLETRFRNRIIATGIGTYKLTQGASAPAGGTWVSRGTATDRFPAISSSQYTGQFTRQDQGQFTRQTPGPGYARATPGPQYAVQYTRIYSSQYLTNYDRAQYTRAQYTRAQYSVQYTRDNPGPQYTRQVGGPQYTVNYGGTPYTRERTGPQYTSNNAYTRDTVGPNYSRSFGRIYAGNYSRAFARDTVGPQYSRAFGRIYSAQYGRVYSANYSRSFARVYGGNYSRSYARVYSGNYSVVIATEYSGTYERTTPYNAPGPSYAAGGYARATAGSTFSSPQYGRTYFGWYWRMGYYSGEGVFEPMGDVYAAQRPGPQYQGNYTRIFTAQYGVAQYSRNFTRERMAPAPSPLAGLVYFNPGGEGFLGDPDHTFYRGQPGVFDSEAFYTQPYYARGQIRYTGSYAVQYSSPVFARQFAGNYHGQYTRSRWTYSEPVYVRQRGGPNYAVQYARVRPGPQYSVQYARVNTGPNYARSTPGPNYDGNYTRRYSVNYAVNYTRDNPGPNYAVQYERRFSANYSAQYTRVFSTNYATGSSEQFTRTYLGQYQRVYAAQYTVQYDRQYNRQYTRSFDVQFARATPGPQYAVQFDRTYSAQYTRVYQGVYARTITGQYTGQYAGDTVTSSLSSQVYTLWIRIA